METWQVQENDYGIMNDDRVPVQGHQRSDKGRDLERREEMSWERTTRTAKRRKLEESNTVHGNEVGTASTTTPEAALSMPCREVKNLKFGILDPREVVERHPELLLSKTQQEALLRQMISSPQRTSADAESHENNNNEMENKKTDGNSNDPTIGDSAENFELRLLQLACPVYNPHYVPTVAKILHNMCFYCAKNLPRSDEDSDDDGDDGDEDETCNAEDEDEHCNYNDAYLKEFDSKNMREPKIISTTKDQCAYCHKYQPIIQLIFQHHDDQEDGGGNDSNGRGESIRDSPTVPVLKIIVDMADRVRAESAKQQKQQPMGLMPSTRSPPYHETLSARAVLDLFRKSFGVNDKSKNGMEQHVAVSTILHPSIRPEHLLVQVLPLYVPQLPSSGLPWSTSFTNASPATSGSTKCIQSIIRANLDLIQFSVQQETDNETGSFAKKGDIRADTSSKVLEYVLQEAVSKYFLCQGEAVASAVSASFSVSNKFVRETENAAPSVEEFCTDTNDPEEWSLMLCNSARSPRGTDREDGRYGNFHVHSGRHDDGPFSVFPRMRVLPDPHLTLDQVSLPKSVALATTISERVSSSNIHQLSQLLERTVAGLKAEHQQREQRANMASSIDEQKRVRRASINDVVSNDNELSNSRRRKIKWSERCPAIRGIFWVPQQRQPGHENFPKRCISAHDDGDDDDRDVLQDENCAFIDLTDSRALTEIVSLPSSLEYGWVVQRTLRDGDVVALSAGFCLPHQKRNDDIKNDDNRVQDLAMGTKTGMMGHRVKILQGTSTLGLNPICLSSYYYGSSVTRLAGVDNSMMDVYVPQSLPARAEVESLLWSSRLLADTGHLNTLLRGPVLDAMIPRNDINMSIRHLTRRDTFLEKDLYFDMMLNSDTCMDKISRSSCNEHSESFSIPVPAICKPKVLWTGKQLLSSVIPKVNIPSRGTSQTSQDHRSTYYFFNSHGSTGMPIRKPNRFNTVDNHVTIKDGEILEGTIGGMTIASRRTGKGLVQTLLVEAGPDDAAKFVRRLQRLAEHWALQQAPSLSSSSPASYTFGICDICISDNTRREIKSSIEKAKRQVVDVYKNFLVENHNVGISVCGGRWSDSQTSRQILAERYELQVSSILNSIRNRTGILACSSWDERTNSLEAMVVANSTRSSTTSIARKNAATLFHRAQIVACVGQQTMEGDGDGRRKLIPLGFNRQRRTLPHFSKDDWGTKSRGFVEHSFVEGLKPHEFFFHAMSGRAALAYAAIKARTLSSVYHSLTTAMETIVTCYDGTVRSDNGLVVQFQYGEDGLQDDSNLGELYELEQSFLFSDSEFRRRYVWFENNDDDDYNDLHVAINDKKEAVDVGSEEQKLDPIDENTMSNDFRSDPNIRRSLDREVKMLRNDQETIRDVVKATRYGGNQLLSYRLGNVHQVIQTAIRKFRIDLDNKTKNEYPDPRFVIERVDNLLQRLAPSRFFVCNENPSLLALSCILIRSVLASKPVLMEYRLSEIALDWVIKEIEYRFRMAKIDPGVAAGVLAAQSLTDVFGRHVETHVHEMLSPRFLLYAGMSIRKVTLGLPRLKEILSVTPKIRSPMMKIFVHDQKSGGDLSIVQKVIHLLEYITVRDVVNRSEIFYDPNVRHTVIVEDQEFVNDYYDFSDLTENETNKMSRWMLRLVLDKDAMHKRRMKIYEIATRLNRESSGMLHVEASDDNADDLVLRIRITDTSSRDSAVGHHLLDAAAEGKDQRTLVEALCDEVGTIMLGCDEQLIRLKRVERFILSRKSIRLRGVDHIDKVYIYPSCRPVWDEQKKVFENKHEYIVETCGSNLQSVLPLDFVDARCTTSNDIVDVYRTLGIEGTRNVLQRELRLIIGVDGSLIPNRHVSLVIDVMTRSGHPTRILDHWLQDDSFSFKETRPLLCCARENTMAPLIEAALHGREENVSTGYSNSIATTCFPQKVPPRIGTGYFDVIECKNK